MHPIQLPALLILLGTLAPGSLGQDRSAARQAPLVSPTGILLDGLERDLRVSPLGGLRLRVTTLAGDFHHMDVRLETRTESGATHVIGSISGNGFLASELQSLVVMDNSEGPRSRLSVVDLDGRELFRRDVQALSDARLSNDGRQLAWRDREGLSTLDLQTLAVVRHSNMQVFAAGSSGELLGSLPGSRTQVVLSTERGERLLTQTAAPVRRLAFNMARTQALILTAQHLHAVDLRTGVARVAFSAPRGSELRDLRVGPRGVRLGLRRRSATHTTGWQVGLGATALSLGSTSGPVSAPLAAPLAPFHSDQIPWPMLPDSQHPIGNTYGEYQRYGGSPYLHPGIDVLGNDSQHVYAVKSGVVKAVLTTSGSYHWRIAIGDEGGAAMTGGYLYAHLEQPTIPFNVGDTVLQGQYIGSLVAWPVAGFTHTHFARIEDSGSQWFGSWLCTENSHVKLAQQSESAAPFFLNARPGSLFAFCNNNTSTYQNPSALVGPVDIIARIADRVASTWVCSVEQIRYTIYPVGAAGAPLVDNKLAVDFNLEIDFYAGGPQTSFLVDLFYKQDSTCETEGDYNDREFYHIITNSNGDRVYDAADEAEAWDTSALSDGDYVIEVTARDTAGNATTASMVVTTANGNP